MVRKLIVHAGTEKTGTTSLQLFLDDHRDELLSRGVHYPETGENYRQSGRFPKHRWLLEGLMAEDGGKLRLGVERLLAQCPPTAHTAILSDEALFGDWQYASPVGRVAFGALSAAFEVELWVWFRDPVDYVRSLYVQILKNPRGPAVVNGRDFSIEAVLEFATFTRRLDYIGYVRDVESLLGAGKVKPFAYDGDTPAAFLHALGVDDIPAERPRENRTVSEAGVSLLHILNRYDLDAVHKHAAVSLIGQLDDLLASQSEPLALSPETDEPELRPGRARAPPRWRWMMPDDSRLIEASHLCPAKPSGFAER